jgi:GH15 family glucan-1,4-alpha-glucosidase
MTIAPVPAAAASARTADFRPIADYGLLADCTSAALVDRSGSIDWLCLPHYDSPAVFARLLDPAAGHWSIAPADAEAKVTRRYLPGTLVVETTFTTGTGMVRMRDAMAFAPGSARPRPRLRHAHEVLRSVEGVSGSVELVMELVPRPEYGLVRPPIRVAEGGGKTFGGPNRIEVASSAPPEARDAGLHARFVASAEASKRGLGRSACASCTGRTRRGS